MDVGQLAGTIFILVCWGALCTRFIQIWIRRRRLGRPAIAPNQILFHDFVVVSSRHQLPVPRGTSIWGGLSWNSGLECTVTIDVIAIHHRNTHMSLVVGEYYIDPLTTQFSPCTQFTREAIRVEGRDQDHFVDLLISPEGGVEPLARALQLSGATYVSEKRDDSLSTWRRR